MRLIPDRARRTPLALLVLPLLIAVSAACDVITADLKHSERAEWRRSYELSRSGRVEINNVNGKINVEPSTGQTVEVAAVKIAKGATAELAKESLNRVEIVETVTREMVRITTKFPRSGDSWLHGSGLQVEYTVKVPAAA
jgi:type VI protein secretion system component VasA